MLVSRTSFVQQQGNNMCLNLLAAIWWSNLPILPLPLSLPTLLCLRESIIFLTIIIIFHSMAPPSQLAIATGSVRRLVKEEASYHKELLQQQAHLDKILVSNGADENAEFQVKQEASIISHL